MASFPRHSVRHLAVSGTLPFPAPCRSFWQVSEIELFAVTIFRETQMLTKNALRKYQKYNHLPKTVARCFLPNGQHKPGGREGNRQTSRSPARHHINASSPQQNSSAVEIKGKCVDLKFPITGREPAV